MTTDNVPMGAATEYTGTPIHVSILGKASAYTIGYDLTAYTQRLLTTDFPRHRRVLITDGHLRERALELIGAGDCAMHVVEYPGTSAVDSCIAGDIPVVLVLPPVY